MSYAGTLTMPSNFVVMQEEEMMYLEGGVWNTYSGKSALIQLTNMAADIVGWAGTAAALGKLFLGGTLTASSGVGALVAFCAAVGLSASIVLAINSAVHFGFALFYYGKYKSYKVNTSTAFGKTIYLGVEKA